MDCIYVVGEEAAMVLMPAASQCKQYAQGEVLPRNNLTAPIARGRLEVDHERASVTLARRVQSKMP